MSKELITQEQQPMAVAIPENYQAPEMAKEDIAIPSIVMWQKMTDIPEFEGENIKPGTFCNPVTGEIYGDKFEAAIISYHVTARIWGDVDKATGRKTIARFSSDGIHWDDNGDIINASEFAWREDGKNAVKSYHYLVVIKGNDMPAMLTFKGASAKNAKKLNSNLYFMRPTWKTWFAFQSKEETTNGNKYYVLTSKPQPKAILSPDEAKYCEEIYLSIKGARITSYEMSANPEGENESSPSEADNAF